ncbi:MAG TPA: helix-turn-helix transcriptional regulator [Streptosporangiaceae bacterium]|nr:helix-turn-helix transcriptional regulator [Streptosporangiaceae bacterium]
MVSPRDADPAATSPRVLVGKMVKYYRTRAGLSQEELGARVYLSDDMIGKIESGRRTASGQFVRACEAIPELGTNGALHELFDQLRDHLKSGSYPGWFDRWLDAEERARRLRSFQLVVVPGLLQNEAYARAVLSTRVGATAEELDEAVAARMDRQQILDRNRPPELWVLLDEAVLRRPVGGPEVMRKQLEHLAGMANRPHIALQVIPVGVGAHEGMRGGAFVLADFDDGPSLGYQDAAVAGQIVEDVNEVESLAVTWDTLRLEALPRSASIALVEDVARTWARQNR